MRKLRYRDLLKITQLVGDTAGFWTHTFCSGVKLLTITHSASCNRWLGMKSQKYKRLFRAYLVQWSSHWPLENQVQVVNTNYGWLWFNKSREEPKNLHYLKLPKVQVLEKPLVWSKTPWWMHEGFYKQSCLYQLSLGGVLFKMWLTSATGLSSALCTILLPSLQIHHILEENYLVP